MTNYDKAIGTTYLGRKSSKTLLRNKGTLPKGYKLIIFTVNVVWARLKSTLKAISWDEISGFHNLGLNLLQSFRDPVGHPLVSGIC